MTATPQVPDGYVALEYTTDGGATWMPCHRSEDSATVARTKDGTWEDAVGGRVYRRRTA